jgi:truncated hemoglobin YjbI
MQGTYVAEPQGDHGAGRARRRHQGDDLSGRERDEWLRTVVGDLKHFVGEILRQYLARESVKAAKFFIAIQPALK